MNILTVQDIIGMTGKSKDYVIEGLDYLTGKGWVEINAGGDKYRVTDSGKRQFVKNQWARSWGS